MPTNRVPPNVSLQLPPATDGELADNHERDLVVVDAITTLRGDDALTRAAIPDPVALDGVLQKINDVVRMARLPSLGAEGEIRKVIVSVPLHVILVDERHPRTDWQTRDRDFEELRASIVRDGLLDPLVVTFLTPDDHSAPPQYLVRLVDGYRRLAVLRDLNAGTALCRVEVDERTGQPLSRAQQLYYWISKQHLHRALKMPQLVYALAQLRAVAGDLPDQRTAAAQTGVSKGTIGRAYAILEESPVVVEAVASRLLPAEVAIQLPQVLPESDQRIAFVEEVLRASPARLRNLTVRDFLDEAQRRRAPQDQHDDDSHQEEMLTQRLLKQTRLLLDVYHQCRTHGIALPSSLARVLAQLDVPDIHRIL